MVEKPVNEMTAEELRALADKLESEHAKPVESPQHHDEPIANAIPAEVAVPAFTLRLPKRLPPTQLPAAPLAFQTMDLTAAPRKPELTSETSSTIPTTAAVISKPTQSLITSKTGFQRTAGLRIFGPGQRAGIRVVRM